MPSIAEGSVEVSLSSILQPFFWEGETAFSISSSFKRLRHPFLALCFGASPWKTLQAEVTTEMHTVWSFIFNLASRSTILYSIKKVLSTSYCFCKKKSNRVLSTRALSKGKAKSVSRTFCRKTCGWMLKNVCKNRVFLERGGEWVTMGKSRDMEDAVMCYMRDKRRKRNLSERRTAVKNAYRATSACLWVWRRSS